MRFAKAHGLGNDFILVAAEELGEHDPADLVPRVCDRHCGIGADGLVAWSREAAVVRMRLFNADGGEAEVSGNGLRCLGAWLARDGSVGPGATLIVETQAGRRQVEVLGLDGAKHRVRAELGRPILASSEIPMLVEPPLQRVVDHELSLGSRSLRVTAVSMGNPHCVVFPAAGPDDAALERLGRELETHPAFPRRTNVEFVTVVGRNELRVRFWERGVGPTRSSGTGAASAAVAAFLRGVADRCVRVVCDGGVLECEWRDDDVVVQTGDAEVICEGHWLPPLYPRSSS